MFTLKSKADLTAVVLRSPTFSRTLFSWMVTLSLGLFTLQSVRGDTGAIENVNAVDRVLMEMFRSPDLTEPAGPAWLKEISRDMSALGGNTLLGVFAVLGTGLLWTAGRKKIAGRVWLLLAIGWVLSTLSKKAFSRPRPGLGDGVEHIISTSFPSGHALMSVLFYSLFVLLVLPLCDRPAWKKVLIFGTVFIVFISGVTRVHLGVHWATDVPAGWIIGGLIAWPGWIFGLRPLMRTPEYDM